MLCWSDQHHYAGHDERCEALGGVAETFRGGVDRESCDACGQDASASGHAFGCNLGDLVHLHAGQREEILTVAYEQRHVVVKRYGGRAALSEPLGIVGRNLYDAVTLFLGPCATGFGHVGGVAFDVDGLGRIEGAGQIAAFGGARVVDNHGGYFRDDFGVIYEGVDYGIGQRQSEKEEHYSDVGKYQPCLPSPYPEQTFKPFHKNVMLRNIYRVEAAGAQTSESQHRHKQHREHDYIIIARVVERESVESLVDVDEEIVTYGHEVGKYAY